MEALDTKHLVYDVATNTIELTHCPKECQFFQESIKPTEGTPRKIHYEVMSNPSKKSIFQGGLIKALDIQALVEKNLQRDKKHLFEVSQSTLNNYAQEVTTKERPFIAAQLAVFQKIVNSNNPSFTAKSIQLFAQEIEKHLAEKGAILRDLPSEGYLKRLAHSTFEYLKTHQLDDQKHTFINDSGLTMAAPETFCTMGSMRHTIMRGTPKFKTHVKGQSLEGKIYADYNDPSEAKGKTVFPDQSLKGDKEYAQAFSAHTQFLVHAIKAMSLASISGYQSETLQKTEMSEVSNQRPELSPSQFIALKPNLVVTSEENESKDYMAKCFFDEQGCMHLELPAKVVDQLKYSEDYDLKNKSGLKKLLVVQEPGTGNVFVTIRLDKTFHHSTLLGGKTVAFAGEADGEFYKKNARVYMKVDTLINKSGHYFPPFESMNHFRKSLIASGLKPGKLKFSSMVEDDPVKALLHIWNTTNESPPIPSDWNTESSLLIQELRKLLEEKLTDQPVHSHSAVLKPSAQSSPILNKYHKHETMG